MKILFISVSCPYPTTGGGAQRTSMLLRGLQRVGETHLFLLQQESSVSEEAKQYLTDQYNLVGMKPIPKHGERSILRYVRPLAPTLVDRLVHNLGNVAKELLPAPELQQDVFKLIEREKYDLVVCRLEGIALAVATWDVVPTIVDIDNYTVQVYAQRVAQSNGNPLAKWILNRHYNNLANSMPGILKKARHLWVSTEADKNALDHPSVSVLSNIPFRELDASDGDGNKSSTMNAEPAVNSSRLLMVGSLDYAVNIEGLNIFLQKVWPMVFKKRPDAVLNIVGRGASKALIERWSSIEGVNFIGFVDELKSVYRDCSYAIAPVFAGGGTKIKVLEALFNNRTCVVARHSMRGYEDVLEHDDSVLVADGLEQMAEHCIRLIESPETRDRLAERGAELVQKHYSYGSFVGEISRSVSELDSTVDCTDVQK